MSKVNLIRNLIEKHAEASKYELANLLMDALGQEHTTPNRARARTLIHYVLNRVIVAEPHRGGFRPGAGRKPSKI